ncbi:MAG: helix-turn-helix domain-containing protein [Lachnospiraceae bacterium]|nr:helix-turn-helix domain-containing protein [Lachnospiraceae bacterium]
MILADKIIELRKKNGWSQEELAEMLDVSRQSISKWESAQSVPDMNRILRLSEVFGVSTDFLLKDEMSLPEVLERSEAETGAGALRTVSMEEAVEFLKVKSVNAGRVAVGVLMCIASPAVLVALSGAVAAGRIALTETAAVGIGLVVLFGLIGAAVALFVTSCLRSAPYEYMEKEDIDTAYGVKGMARERREQFRPVFGRGITLGVALCVISAMPLFITMIFFGENAFAETLAVSFMLCLIAIGVFCIVRVAIVQGSYQMLLEEGSYTREEKHHENKTGWIAGAYWLTMVAIFLAWGFLGNGWDKSWIIWPVAGVVFALLMTIVRGLKKD